MVAITAENLVFGYQQNRLLFDQASFELKMLDENGRGSIVAVVGSSGSGKTTLLKLIAGIELPNKGQIQYDPPTAPLSYLPQDAVLFENLSREENGRYYQFVRAHRDNFNEDTFQKLIDKLRLRDVLFKSDKVEKMSGGERQRLALLRALSIRPRFLLLDEPCNGLDTSVKQEFLVALRDLADEFQILVIYVTHHRDEVLLLADSVLYFDVEKSTNLCSVSLWELDKFLDQPPTLEAAQFGNGLPLNVISCLIKDKLLVIEKENLVLARINNSGIAEEHVVAAFSPLIVTEGRGDRDMVTITSSSKEFIFLSTKIENRKIIASNDLGIVKSIALEGEAILFDLGGKFVRKVSLSRPD